MKTELKVLALGAVLLSGCGSYSSNQESSVSAVLTVNRTEILMGDSIELDASQSVADKLSWTMNGVALSSCGELSICTLAINEKGVYEISVEASSLNSKTTAVTAFVTVSVTEKISAKTASASGSSVAESSNTPAREPVDCSIVGGSMHGTQCNALSLTASASLLAGVGPGGTIVDSSDPSLVQFAGARNSTNDATYVYSSEYSSTASLAVIRRTTISTGATTTLAGGDMGGGVTCPGSNATTCKDGVGTAARFNTPNGIVKLGNYLYINDLANDRLRRLDLTNNTVDTVAGSGVNGTTDNAAGLSATFDTLLGITTDGTDLYLLDKYQVRKVTVGSNFAVTRIAGTTTTGSADGAGLTTAKFTDPRGITTDGVNLYITDNALHNVRKVVISTGVVSTIAGGNTGGGIPCVGSVNTNCKEGVGTAAQFYNPRAIITDKTYLYVADAANDRIRTIKISDGTVTTLVGTGVRSWSGTGTGTSLDIPYPSNISTDGTSLYVESLNPIPQLYKIN